MEIALALLIGFAAASGLCLYLTKELRAGLDQSNQTIRELLDKFVHNRQPQRIVEQRKTEATEFVEPTDAMGDPVTRAEEAAWEASRPKKPEEQTA
jgi:hypothetical protein